jgi:hypothetical protein
MNKTKTYAEKLRDPRWQEKRLRLFDKAEWTCELCERVRPEEGLQVHHPIYLTGLNPWDYPDEIMMTLCDSCHVDRQEVERQWFYKAAMAIRYKSTTELQEMPVWHMIETRKFIEKKNTIGGYDY